MAHLLGEFVSLEHEEPEQDADVVREDGDGADDGNGGQHVGDPSACATDRRYFGGDMPELRLHEEMIDFAQAFRPTRSEVEVRASLVETVSVMVTSIWPDALVQPFGSYATGLYLPSSDIDLVVLGTGPETKQGQVATLKRIASALRAAEWQADDLEVIANAKVPIVKFRHADSGLDVDICLESSDGLLSSALARKASRKFAAYKFLVPLLKKWLLHRGLNDTFTGGVGSFLLQLMTISSLQHPPGLAPLRATRGNLGALLLHFFETYGMRLNYETTGIAVTDGGRFYSKRERGWRNVGRPFLCDCPAIRTAARRNSRRVRSALALRFCVGGGRGAGVDVRRARHDRVLKQGWQSWRLSAENPMKPTVDVGANAYNIKAVRSAFAHSYRVLLATSARLRVDDSGSYLTMLRAILGNEIEAEMKHRFQLHAMEQTPSFFGAPPLAAGTQLVAEPSSSATPRVSSTARLSGDGNGIGGRGRGGSGGGKNGGEGGGEGGGKGGGEGGGKGCKGGGTSGGKSVSRGQSASWTDDGLLDPEEITAANDARPRDETRRAQKRPLPGAKRPAHPEAAAHGGGRGPKLLELDMLLALAPVVWSSSRPDAQPAASGAAGSSQQSQQHKVHNGVLGDRKVSIITGSGTLSGIVKKMSKKRKDSRSA